LVDGLVNGVLSMEPARPAPAPHLPVLAQESLEFLAPVPGGVYVDGTLGAGGHTELLLEATAPDGRVYGIDRDRDALRLAGQRLERFGERFVPIHGNHEDLQDLLQEIDAPAANGILLDLGVSSMQLDDAGRGFSFREDGPLDMRMNPDAGRPVSELLADTSEDDLTRILFRWGEERRARAIAREVIRVRESEPLTRTSQLAALVERVLGPAARRFRIHPATRTFQALRIVVNDEVAGLEKLVEDAVGQLKTGGRLVVIAYHSLEDRAIKRTLRSLANRCTCPPKLPVCGCRRRNLVRILTSRPVRPGSEEIERNPRSRSGRLRAAEAI